MKSRTKVMKKLEKVKAVHQGQNFLKTLGRYE